MSNHPNRTEIELLFKTLKENGVNISGFYDSGDNEYMSWDINKIIEDVLSLDECQVYYECDNFTGCLCIVLGNEPGVAVYDYSYPRGKHDIGSRIEHVLTVVYDELNREPFCHSMEYHESFA